MNLNRTTKHQGFYLVCLLATFLIVSCRGATSTVTNIEQIPSPQPSERVVEFGASIDEWKEANQADGLTLGGPNNHAAYPAQTLPEAPPLSNSYPAPELEQSQTNGSSSQVDSSTAAENVSGVPSNVNPSMPTLVTLNDISYMEITWEALVPADFTAEAIMAKYEDRLAATSDGSSEAADLYTQMQAEFNNAPVNDALDGALIRLPGFIAPLEYTDELVTEFLLVPYFGACIHVPAPPSNQTVLVKMADGQGIRLEDTYNPFWIMGELTAEGATTELAEAGYFIENAIIELYSDT